MAGDWRGLPPDSGLLVLGTSKRALAGDARAAPAKERGCTVIIDVHSHLFGDNSSSRNFQYPGEPDGPVSLDTFARHALAEPVDFMMLSADPDLGKTAEGLSRGNDRIAELVRRHPRRFAGLCQVSPFLVNESLAEMDRHIARGNMLGIGELCQYVLKYETDDPRMNQFIEKAVELDVPILEHSSNEEQSLGIERLARRYPRARFIMAHMGGMYGWPQGLEIARRNENIWVDTSGYGLVIAGAMRKALELLGPSRILFGVDFPLILAGPLAAALEQLGLSDTDFDAIAWRNACDLFHIDSKSIGS